MSMPIAEGANELVRVRRSSPGAGQNQLSEGLTSCRVMMRRVGSGASSRR